MRRQESGEEASPVAGQPRPQAADGVDGEGADAGARQPGSDDARAHGAVEGGQQVIVERGAVVGLGVHARTEGDGLGPGVVIVRVPSHDLEKGIVLGLPPQVDRPERQGQKGDGHQGDVLVPGQASVEDGFAGCGRGHQDSSPRVRGPAAFR